MMPSDLNLLKNHMKKHSKVKNHTMIVKPQDGAEGCGIFLA
jgi:hypothetical protein